MTADLEARVRAELAARAADVGMLPVGGAALRETARRRRTARLRAGAVVVGVVAVVTVGAAVLRGPADDAAPAPVEQPSTTTTTAPARPEPAWLQVPLTDDMVGRVVAAAGGDSSTAPVVSARVPGSDRVVVLLGGRRAADGVGVGRERDPRVGSPGGGRRERHIRAVPVLLLADHAAGARRRRQPAGGAHPVGRR